MHAQDPVNRVMTEAVLSVEAGAPAGEVLRLFAACPIHHLPVVDGGAVIGVLGSTDVMKIDMLLPKGGVSAVEYLNQRMCVRQLVRREPVVVGERQSVEEAAALMAKHGIHALPVVNVRSIVAYRPRILPSSTVWATTSMPCSTSWSHGKAICKTKMRPWPIRPAPPSMPCS